MGNTFGSALPTRAGAAPSSITRIYAFYRLGAGAAFILAGIMLWEALHFQPYWISDAAGYTSLALSVTSMILAIGTEFCKPVYYHMHDLPKYDWPFAEILVVSFDSGKLIGSCEKALTVGMSAPEDHCAWRNLRPTVTMFALMSAILSTVVLIANVG